MFKVAANQAIGEYLDQLINKKYRSARQFGKECLELQNLPAEESDIDKMNNRLSQIKLGHQGIQLEDLTAFCYLLDVTCETILSAGNFQTEPSSRMTNYKLSFIKDEAIWEEYIHRDDKLILNADEYGKTVLDYAFEHKNYPLLHYLVNKKYIWFMDADAKQGISEYTAGTSIERRQFPWSSDTFLQNELNSRKELRTQMITLAIENQDFDMLQKMRAREIPQFYETSRFSFNTTDFSPYYDERFIHLLAASKTPVLDYFSTEFQVKSNQGAKEETDTFIYPFLGELIAELQKSGHRATEAVLKRALSHNKQALRQLKETIRQCLEFYRGYEDGVYLKNCPDIASFIADQIRVHQNGTIISCYARNDTKSGFVTNVIQTDTQSKDFVIQNYIDELNEICQQMQNIKPLITQLMKEKK